MSRKNICLCALSILISAGAAPAVAQPSRVDIAKLDATALRALFHSSTFNISCPLDVYAEDYTKVTASKQQFVGINRNEPTQHRRSSLLTIREVLWGPEFAVTDGLEDYDETFRSAELSRPVEVSN